MLFTNTNHLRTIEIQMQQVPNFKPRRSGLRIIGLTSDDYDMALVRLLNDIQSPMLTARIILRGTEMRAKYKSAFHRKAFTEYVETHIANPYVMRREYIAALFLLSADKNLWQRSQNAVAGCSINLGKVNLHDITVGEYALYKAAKTIYTGRQEISVGELCDCELIDDSVLCTILNAFLIARNGIGMLSWRQE